MVRRVRNVFDLMFIGDGGPPSPVNYKGVWNANTNSPSLSSGGGGGVKGDYYIVSVGGSTLIDGVNDWQVTDWIVHNGSTWDKIDNSDVVISVNSQTGSVQLNADDIPFDDTTAQIGASEVQQAIDILVANQKDIRTIGLKAGEALSAYSLVYRASDGKVYKADKRYQTNSNVLGMILTSAVLNDDVEILRIGIVQNAAWSWSLLNQRVYLGNSGNITSTIPTTSGEYVIQVAEIISSDTLYLDNFNVKILN